MKIQKTADLTNRFSTCGKLVLGFSFTKEMAKLGSTKTEGQVESASELDMPIWSVVSFDKCEFSGLKYADAISKLTELESKKVAGLCIVTDDVAARIKS